MYIYTLQRLVMRNKKYTQSYIRLKQLFIVLVLLAASSIFIGGKRLQGPQKQSLDNSQKTELILPPFLEKESPWADSVFSTLTPRQRIAQLFMVAAYSNKGQSHVNEISNLIKEHHIGGLIFFQGGPSREAILTNKYQALSQVPLMISIDGEWGLSMRLDSTVKFPKQMTLGAIRNDSLIYQMGKEIAEQCKRIGIHVNLAPVVDVNNNPDNPVINYRSFGQNKYNVARKGLMYMKGMQDAGVMANAKHFPGHGDTDTDSHKALPIIKHSKARIDSIELYPFKVMMKAGLGSVMVAHLYIPALDSTPNTATTLSPKVVNGLLKNELGFKGLAFTDALNMKGVSSFYAPGEVDLKALLAGNDVLLFAEDVPKAISFIENAVKEGKITQKEIDKRCLKILKAKAWLGLDSIQPISLNNLHNDLNNTKAEVINKSLYSKSLTVIKNSNSLIPLKRLDTTKVASISIGFKSSKDFTKTLDKYTKVAHFSLSDNPTADDLAYTLRKLEDYTTVLVALGGMNQRPYRDFGINNSIANFISDLSQRKNVALSIFGNPYAIKKQPKLAEAQSIVIAYEDRTYTQDFVAQLMFGGIAADGILPVSVSKEFSEGTSIVIPKMRLGFHSPEEMNIKIDYLNRIDSIVNASIVNGVFPGCQIVAAKNGKVFLNKSYGHFTYENKQEVDENTIYDLASITKIVASTSILMHMQDEGLIDLDKPLKTYLPDLVDSTAYAYLTLKEMLTHQAGLTPWIPFYVRTLKIGQPNPEIYSKAKTATHNAQVAENMWISSSYKDSIFKRILETPVSPQKKYKYSDVGYYFIKEIIEQKMGKPMNEVLDSLFIHSMGLDKMGYLPLSQHKKNEIAPTENDQSFRMQLIHGYVHDQGAAMMNGIGGHAGVFSNAIDLAAYMQMLSNYGEYGGERYLSEKTVKQYTSSPFLATGNRRGIGFDKPVREGGSGPTCSLCASASSFGHSGFTGTLTWADPEKDLVYVFLSNRVYPDATNFKIVKDGVRTQIQQILYDATNDLNQ